MLRRMAVPAVSPWKLGTCRLASKRAFSRAWRMPAILDTIRWAAYHPTLPGGKMPDSSRLDLRPPPLEREGEGGAPSPWIQSRLARLFCLLVLAAASASIVSREPRSFGVAYAPGDIAQEDVKAAADFLVEDETATERARREAELSSPKIYDYDPDALAYAVSSLEEDLKVFPNHRLPGSAERALRRGLEAQWGFQLRAETVRLLATAESRQRLVAEVRGVLEPLYRGGVVANRNLLLAEGRKGILVRNLATREEKPLLDVSLVHDFEEARGRLEGAQRGRGIAPLSGKVAAALLRPNLSYSAEETTARRSAVRAEVGPVLHQVRRGEMIVREGDRVSPEQARKLAGHAQLVGGKDRWGVWLGVLLLTALLCYSAYDFGRSNIKKFRAAPRDLAFLASLLLAWLLLERAGLLVAEGIGNLVPTVPLTPVLFVLPLASAIMIVRAVLNSESALIFGVPFCALASLPFERSLLVFFLLLTGGLVGAHRAARACRRVDFLRAGLWMGLAQAVCVWGVGWLEGWALQGQAVWTLVGAFSAGIAGGLLALSIVPVAEGAFGYTTDMRLMELASLDHPLLRELMVRAPGTYHHAIVTGTLAKAAAEAIGAKALLAAVAAYYHDIGKLSKPAYYVENQADGGNRHEKLRPSMSSLILLSHVKEGVELARRHRLGSDIVDVIGQHHGTGLIHYFYEKACQSARPDLHEVQESDYRYPGPKPRSREAALVLLADAVEAAARTLGDPKQARIQGLVQNIVNRIFSDGQLDECDLTLKDLHEIARSFTRILTGIHHQRIDYPLAARKEKRLTDVDLDSERLRAGRYRRREAPATGTESLKRLGM
jgi:cyclic-di-AMP phosphodiesterase PgpH